jgi:hypothetical protein
VRCVPALDDRFLARAFHPGDAALQLDDVAASRALMQPVDVLSNQQKVVRAPFEIREREMTRIGLRGGDALAPPRIPVPDQLRIARERGWRRKLARIIARPQSGLHVSERRESGLRGDACAGKRDDEARSTERSHQCGVDGGRRRNPHSR